MVDGATDVSCLEEETIIVFPQFEMTTLQLLKESLKKRVKVVSKTAMVYFQSYNNLF